MSYSTALRAALALLDSVIDGALLTQFCAAFEAALFASSSTVEGGSTFTLVNGTGAPSVKGSVVSASTTADGAFVLQENQYDAIGIVYESGVADGQPCRVVYSGIAEVLFEDGVAPVHGYWVQTALTDGRATNAAAPSGGGFTNANEHFKEIGHCLESKSAGTDVFALCVVHFN